MVKKLAQLRKDLYEEGLKVPIGDIYFFSMEKLKYRWSKNDENFQVFYNSEWLDAYSIDWNLINIEAQYFQNP